MKKGKFYIWIVVCLAFLSLTHLLFKIPAPIKFLEAVWSAGDFITFTGTVVLGAVAVWQSKKANELSDKLITLETDKYKIEKRPFVMVTDYSAFAKKQMELITKPDRLYIQVDNVDKKVSSVLCLSLSLTNTTNSYVVAEFDSAESVDGSVHFEKSASSQKTLKLGLMPGATGEIVFYADKSFFENMLGKKSEFRFILENRFSLRYAENFHVIITSLSADGCSPDANWYLSLIVQEFSIGRFEKNPDGKIIEIKEEL